MRKPRQYSEKGFYHTFARGVNKQNIFYEKADKDYFLKIVYVYAKKYKIKIHSYVLLDNHFHLQLEDPKKHVSDFMGLICSLYARYFNKKYDRTGHLFQERFGSEIVNSKRRFIECFRYIMQNPQKAGICKASDYEWSSYKLYKAESSWVERSLLLEYFGSLENLYNYLEEESDKEFIDIELRMSEKNEDYINRIKKILNLPTPMIPPEWSKEKVIKYVKRLRKKGFSIRVISRVTGISKGLIQLA